MPTTKALPRTFKCLTVPISILLLSTTPSNADDTPAFSFSANATLASDYRFRGISLSDKDIALQGGFDIASKSGFYVGAWGSSIEQFAGSELELDVYGGYTTNLNNLNFDIGILAYTYPGSDNTTYWEAYSSVAGSLSELGWTIGGAYAFDQSNIGNNDNLYLYLDTSTPLGNSKLTFTTHLGYEDGAFGDDKFDWSAGLSYDLDKFTLGISYIDTNTNTREGKAGVIASISSAF